jgi:uncharacterized protein (TIGR02757 family)
MKLKYESVNMKMDNQVSTNMRRFLLWHRISPESLYIPLDVHTGNMARKLQLLDRKQDDWKALEQLMQTLREFDPTDPVKYDLALFGLGVFEKF